MTTCYQEVRSPGESASFTLQVASCCAPLTASFWDSEKRVTTYTVGTPQVDDWIADRSDNPDEVVKFADTNQLRTDLRLANMILREEFPESCRVQFSHQSDPELDDEWIVATVYSSAPIAEMVDSMDRAVMRWIKESNHNSWRLVRFSSKPV